MIDCRVIVETEPQSGSWNMAIDECLLESTSDANHCTVRLYRWQEATLSLGYFQKNDTIPTTGPLAELPKVRRLSGGGAILHHHEWTYSVTIPCTHPLANTPRDLYGAVHHEVLAMLDDMGVKASLRGSKDDEANKRFLCFGRGDSQDIVLADHKILGSAQRRRKGVILQHGSLLLSASEFAPQFLGLFDLYACDQLPAHFADGLAQKIAKVLTPDGEVTTAPLTATEQQLAAELERERYRSLDWKSTR